MAVREPERLTVIASLKWLVQQLFLKIFTIFGKVYGVVHVDGEVIDRAVQSWNYDLNATAILQPAVTVYVLNHHVQYC